MVAQFGAYRTALTAATATTGGAVLSLANPEGIRLIVTRLILDIQTQSTGAASVDAGIGSGATTSYDNLIDGCSIATAGAFDNVTDAGTNGKSRQVWAAANYLTITTSATAAGLVGYAMIEYKRTADES